MFEFTALVQKYDIMRSHTKFVLVTIICCLSISICNYAYADNSNSVESRANRDTVISGDGSELNFELSENENASMSVNTVSSLQGSPQVEITEPASDISTDSNLQTNTLADSKSDLIKFAGVWIRGNAADAAKVCPVGVKYAMGGGDNEAAAAYSRKLLQLIRSKQKPNGLRLIDLVAPDDYLPQAGSGRALVLACAINYEITEDGVLPSGVVGCFGEIGFDLIICDFSDRRVVFSIPCRLVFQEHARKSDSHLIKLYEQHLPQIFMQLAEYKWNCGDAFSSVGIGTVTILQPKNTRDLPPNVVDMPETISDRIEMLYAQIAASRFFDATGIPIQPYSKGEEAVFYGLQENLADASSLIAQKIREENAEGVGFLLKKPDYKIDVKGLFARQKQGSKVNYTSLGKVVITDQGGNEIHNVQYDACADLIPYRAGVSQDVWHYSADASVRLFQKFASALNKTKAKDEKIKLFFKDCSAE
jgi:hypothetical protein